MARCGILSTSNAVETRRPPFRRQFWPGQQARDEVILPFRLSSGSFKDPCLKQGKVCRRRAFHEPLLQTPLQSMATSVASRSRLQSDLSFVDPSPASARLTGLPCTPVTRFAVDKAR